MRNYGFLVALLAAAVFSPVTLAENYYEVNTAPTSHVKAYRPDQIIVKFKDDSGVEVRRNAKGRFKSSGVNAIDNVLQQIGVSEVDRLMPLTGALPANAPRRIKAFNGKEVELHDLSKLYCIKAEGNINVEDVLLKLRALPDVEYAEPNYLVYACASSAPNDPLYSQQWGIPAVKADKLWTAPTITDKRPVIAILDTGVDIAHPDLQANIWTNPSESTGSGGYDDDGNGFVDDVCGWDFINQTGIIEDYNGHGTHCAGIAAAVGNNGIGICGANPDARIMPVTVMQSDGTGDIATIVRGIDYATANGADVLSMSFGTYAYTISMEQALARAYMNSVLVAAAGNDGHSITPFAHCSSDGPMFPAAFTFVLGVQASSEFGLAGFSNFDNDGPITFNPTFFSEEQMYNYELTAPGTEIISTYPGGRYKSMNGTSMACPLVAGAVSKLISAKEYATKELLFGDLIHSAGGNVNFEACYKITDADRAPKVSLVTWRIEDEKDNDGRYDAGETIKFYPTIRNEWGMAKNAVVWLELGENEGKVVEMSQAMADFGKTLSSYAKAESANPIVFKIKDNVVDGRHIRLVLYAQCDGMAEPSAHEIVITAENGIELKGIIESDMSLDPDQYYIVTQSVVIPDNVTLTIKPGAKVHFKDNTGFKLASGGRIIAKGTPEKPITFTSSNLSYSSAAMVFDKDTDGAVEYAIFENMEFALYAGSTGRFINCEFRYCYDPCRSFSDCVFENCNIVDCINHDWGVSGGFFTGVNSISDTNIINFIANGYGNVLNDDELSVAREILNGKNNFWGNSFVLTAGGSNIGVVKFDNPSFLGTGSEKIARNRLLDLTNSNTYTKFDLSNMLTQPNPNAHGVVWKVLVNGYDAQDEFEMLPPLGVGKQKFEVWYSKKIDESVTPIIRMGVRPPYNQTAIAQDGSWRTEKTHFISRDSQGNITDERDVEHSVYTAYLDIKGSMAIDGLNRIYVSGGQDLEGFDIPLENMRFNVEVQAAGSMSTGFFATPGIGKVDLEWEDLDMNVEDIMGYNLYRLVEYETIQSGYDENWNWVEKPVTVTDTIRINRRLIDEPHYTDFDVIPGQRYDYFYKVMRTDFNETSPSKVVSVVPLTASKGDANGSLAVDVADVVTEISYLTGGNPQPFIFEAADVNSDEAINILDVVGTINIIVNPQGAQAAAADAEAEYSIVDGILYVDSPVALGGLQFRFTLDANAADPMPLEALDGFEFVNSRTADQVLMLAYSMSGKCLLPGKHAVAKIGDAVLSEIVLSDKQGHNVTVTGAELNGIIDATEAHTRLLNPVENPFSVRAVLPFYIADSGMHKVRMAFYDAQGHILHIWNGVADGGMHSYTWNASGMPAGAYFVICDIDGKHVGSAKLIKK